MPSEVKWLIENRVIHVRYHGVVTAEDVRATSGPTLEFVEKGTQPVHVFTDASDIEGVTIGISELRGLSTTRGPNVGWMIVIAPNALHRFFISLGLQFAGGNYKFVKTQQEVVEFLRERDPSLAAAQQPYEGRS